MRATILVVDDSQDVLNLIHATLAKEHEVRAAASAPAALKLAFEEPRPDLILLDVEMPDVSGYDLCRTLKGSPAVADIPVVFLTGRIETRDVVQGFQLGALDYLAKPVSPPVLAARVRNHLELIERRNKQDELLRSRGAELEQTRLELVRRLGRAMEYHESSAIGNRVIRLGHYARALAQAAGARTILSDMMMKAAPLHDIGKVGVPAALLRKSGQLTVPEREQMQRHPEIGAEIIGSHNDPLLKLARTLAFTHHERWDGSGYPSRAAGNDIPWAGRVMAIVDAWESMTVTQFHREPLPLDLAADEITKGAGGQFDPTMVQAFRKALPELRRIHGTYADQLGDLLNLDFSAAPALQTQKVDEQRAMQEQAAQALRAADAARARALADAQARLKIEHDLAAAAQKDIVSQHAARKQAEEQAAREAELLAAAKKRAAEESAAARFARDRAESDAKASELARRRHEAEEAAARAAQERAEADNAAAEAAQQRARAENAAQGAAVLRVQAEKEADAAAQQRQQAEAELEALRAAAVGTSRDLDALNARIVEDLAAAQTAREAARQATAAAAKARADAEAALEAASPARQEAEAEVVRLREASAGELQRLMAVRKRVEEETAAANAARAAAAELSNLDEVMRERMALEEQVQAAANQRAAAEKALEGLRQAAERERRALEEAKARLAAGDLEALAAQRTELNAEIGGITAERESLEQQAASDQRAAALTRQLEDARQQVAKAEEEKRTKDERIASATAELNDTRQQLGAAQQALVVAKTALAVAKEAALAPAPQPAPASAGDSAGVIARLQDELRTANAARDVARKDAEEARAGAKTAQPLVIGPPPAPVPRRAGALAAFVIGAAVAAAGVYVVLTELDKPEEQKAAPAVPVAAARPVSLGDAGEPLKLRLDSAWDRIAPKEK